MRRFSFRPALTIKGRKYKGLRGFAGKPFHPPLTDIPVAAYVFAALFDVLSAARDDAGMRDAATWLLAVGAVFGALSALTGWADWHRSSQVGTQARRTINAHAVVMITASVLVVLDLLSRAGDARTTSWPLALLTVVAAGITTVGATYGGSLVFDYGFNVETAGDHPVWHESETDVFPGQH
ncbi:MAG TPA: DUF2231 domain-containing protein [Frankiaceae bacterium]|nr:DUF2231 domain-containing protein [Frankiaceae bacterium]